MEQPPPPPAAAPQPLRLHIGGERAAPGWKILNAQPKPGVDFVGSAMDLSRFASGSVAEIYASHVYEHLDYVKELVEALAEAFRVLTPGGILWIGVPDLEALARLILKPGLDVQAKHFVMRMIYGGHVDKWDYHGYGFTFELLGQWLWETGFREIQRYRRFGMFQDTTDMQFQGEYISLNVRAVKPVDPPTAPAAPAAPTAPTLPG